MQLKNLRKKRGLSLKEAGDILGVAESTLSLYENGKREASYSFLQKASAFFEVSIDYLLSNAEGENITCQNPQSISIPILESVSVSGENIEYAYSPEQEAIELGNPQNYFYFKMHGESMEPQISDGDIALIKKQSDVPSTSVAAVICKDNPVMLRRIIKHSNTIILQPFNAKFQNIFVNNSDDIIVLGVVTQIIRKW